MREGSFSGNDVVTVANSENQIINIQDDKGEEAVHMENIQAWIHYETRETMLAEEGINLLVPYLRACFKPRGLGRW